MPKKPLPQFVAPMQASSVKRQAKPKRSMVEIPGTSIDAYRERHRNLDRAGNCGV